MTVDIERCFDLALPPWQPPAVDGLVALVDPDASTVWADRLLVRHEDGFVVWRATGADPAGQALAVARLPEVSVVVLLVGGQDARRAALAMEVGRHVRAVRVTSAGHKWCVTSPVRPEPSGGAVRVPHLVSVRHRGVVTDTVVWEVIDREQAELWLAGPLPDPRLVEENLAGLLGLRAAVRARRFPMTAAGARLERLLGGRDLSIRLVYQRPGLFHVLLSGSEAVGTGPDTPPSGAGESERVL